MSLPRSHPFAAEWPIGLAVWAPDDADLYVHGPSRRKGVRIVGWSRSLGTLDGAWVSADWKHPYRVRVDDLVEMR